MSDVSARVVTEGAAGAGRRRWRYLWVVGFTLYAAAITYFGWREVGAELASINLIWVAAIVGNELIVWSIRALKWRIALGHGANAVPLFFVSKAGGNTTPGRIGELAPLLFKRFRTAKIGAWIVVDRLIEIAATLGFGIIGFIAIRYSNNLILATWFGMIVLLIVLPIVVLTRRSFFLWIAERTRPESVTHRLSNLLAAMSDEIGALRAKLPVLSALTIVATALDIVAGVFLLLCFGHAATFQLLAAVQCLHGLVSALPFAPNATGIPYAASAVLLHEAGGIPYDVLVASVALRSALMNGVFWTCFAVVTPGLHAAQKAASGQGELFDRLAANDALYDYPPEAGERLNGLVKHKGRLLDIGCGDGVLDTSYDADFMAGIDLSPRCARLARRHGVAAVVSDAPAGIPFADGSFDTVYCIAVLHHLHGQWAALFDEIDRVLRPSGTLVIVEPDARNLLVRLTQSPRSPLRTAPWDDEPAIHPDELVPALKARGYETNCSKIDIEGRQLEPSPFPLWNRVLKAPFVIVLAVLCAGHPNKFAVVARRTGG